MENQNRHRLWDNTRGAPVLENEDGSFTLYGNRTYTFNQHKIDLEAPCEYKATITKEKGFPYEEYKSVTLEIKKLPKQWKDYFDEHGLIVGLNYSYKPEDKIQRGDTLQRCGMWYLFAKELLDLYELNYLRQNFSVDTYQKIKKKYLDMYKKCFLTDPIPHRHPDYYKTGGTGKTSRDQMIPNYWALLDIDMNEKTELLSKEWAALKGSKFLLPANDILGPEHFSIFWRYFYLRSKWLKPFWYSLMLLGDLHNVLSTFVKIFHCYKQRYHNDDPTRICMILGASTIVPTFLGRFSAYTYWIFRPAWKPKTGSYYFRKPNNEFERDHKTIGANYAMKHYCEWQEAPWDEMLKPIAENKYPCIL